MYKKLSHYLCNIASGKRTECDKAIVASKRADLKFKVDCVHKYIYIY